LLCVFSLVVLWHLYANRQDAGAPTAHALQQQQQPQQPSPPDHALSEQPDQPDNQPNPIVKQEEGDQPVGRTRAK